LTNKTGETLDTSSGSEPLTFMEGSETILPALEAQIRLMQIGDRKKVNLSAADGYGVHNPELVLELERAELAHIPNLKVGDQLQANSKDGGPMVFIVKKLSDSEIHLDGNHPLAGVDLSFDIEVTNTRDATDEEVAHGHAHGPGGHHH
jgi:FKBP-type peptidyl-prolyl cis-trans isomerase SlyD